MEHPQYQLHTISAAMRARYVLLTLAVVTCVPSLAQSGAPTDNKNTTSQVLVSMDLAGEIPDGAGRQLRARTVKIDAGGHTAAHTHTNRPTLEYVLQGSVVEIRNGVEVPHAAGEMVAAGNGVSHYWENRGSVPVVLMPVDVFKP